ncbi:MAG TPA: homoserine O-acetyltransferase [Acidimicrobiales bacterium]|nr:homoserine O-acetyltransferase [Acidimicrobiales bacterium]
MLRTDPGWWRPGSDPGDRRFERVAEDGLELEARGHLPHVDVAYETWGTLDPSAANAVLVLHALTGDAHVAGPSGPGQATAGWWDGLVGPGAAIDTDRWFVVCPNVLGGCQGTTGPSSPAPDGRAYGSRFPVLTIRDQVAVEAALADRLGIRRWAAVVGGSMGGMRVLEWCVGHPRRVERAVALAVGAAATAEQIALSSLQARAIRMDPSFRGGDYYDAETVPRAGMAVARGLAHLSYRSARDLETRFGHEAQAGEDPLHGGRYAIESYLDHHGDKLVARFDPNSYVVLSAAMNHHDVGRGRGGIARALAGVTADVTVAGISSDRLYPLWDQEELAGLLPGGRPVVVIDSPVGHDGFLVEVGAVGAVIAGALA